MRNLIRMAGQKIRAFDDAYASKVADLINSSNSVPGTTRNSLENVALVAGALPATRKFDVGDVENTMPAAKALHSLMGYGIPALNAGVRYGVPLVGAKLAADGIGALYDVASQTPVLGNNPSNEETLMIRYA